MTREELKLKYLNAPAYFTILDKGNELVNKAMDSGKDEDWEEFAKYRNSVMRLIKTVGLYEEFGRFLDDNIQRIFEEFNEEDEEYDDL